jgi:non-homologous end joining protein Ku
MRPHWKGYLKLALVSCPIALHAASSSAERIALRQINKATGNRLRQQLIDEETRVPVAPEHKGRGYEVAKGQYLIVEDAELEAITSPAIAIPIFVQVPCGLSKKNAAAMPPMTKPAPMLFQNEAANLTRSLRCNTEPLPK